MYAKYAVASLATAVSSTATPGAFPGNTYPSFASPNSPALTGTELSGSSANTNLKIQKTYADTSLTSNFGAGPLRGFRNGYAVFPTQKVVANAATANALGTVATMGTTERTFWQQSAAQLGVYMPEEAAPVA